MPFSKVAPARTRATRCGALMARHLACADSMSLNAIAIPAAREPGPLVTRCRSRTVAKVDSIGFVGSDSLSWPHHDGLGWPHLVGVSGGVTV